MKHLDEYRDPHLFDVLMQEIHKKVSRPWTLMEICGGQTHSLVKNGIVDLLPKGAHPGSWSGLSGLCYQPGCDRRSHPPGSKTRCDFVLVWRYVARAGQPSESAGSKSQRRRCSHSLFAFGSGATGHGQPRKTGSVFAVGFETTALPPMHLLWSMPIKRVQKISAFWHPMFWCPGYGSHLV